MLTQFPTSVRVYMISSDELMWLAFEQCRSSSNSKAPSFDWAKNWYWSYYKKSFVELLNRLAFINESDFVILVDKNNHPFHVGELWRDYT